MMQLKCFFFSVAACRHSLCVSYLPRSNHTFSDQGSKSLQEKFHRSQQIRCHLKWSVDTCLILVRLLNCDSLIFRQKHTVSRTVGMDVVCPCGQYKELFPSDVHAVNFSYRSVYLLLLYSNPVTQKFTTDPNYRES